MTPQEKTYTYEDDEDEPGFFRRYWVFLCILALAGAGGVPLLMKVIHGGSSPPRRQEVISMVKLLPMPTLPPMPTPPPVQQETVHEENKMIDQAPVTAAPKTPDKPVEAKAPAPGPLGTGITGNGPPDGFGLGSGNGTGGIGGSGYGTGGGGKWGWYAGEVQTKIAEALRNDSRTKNAALRIQVRIWPSLTGRITRAQLQGSTGSASLDQAIQDGVLTGLQLQEPPPEGMPTPIVLRLTALRPN